MGQVGIQTLSRSERKPRASLQDYIAIARLDHGTKHVLIVPGFVLAYLLRGPRIDHLVTSVLLGLLTVICVASANYVINEWLDREFDKVHPDKSGRASVQREMNSGIVWMEWALLLLCGLTCAWLHSKTMFLIGAVFGLQGVVYNIPSLRTKDKPFLDVISESINNPIRLTVGWLMVDPSTLPPASILLTYWAGGAFLMAAKRLSEYKQLSASHGVELLWQYRASFKRYNEKSLLLSCFVYALLSIFFLGVFLIKYRIEYIVLIPIIIVLFAYYLSISFAPNSSAQRPELLYREKGLVTLILLLTGAFAFATLVDLPVLESLTGQMFIQVP